MGNPQEQHNAASNLAFMKKLAIIIGLLSAVILSACTMGSGTRTSRRLYQPTKSSNVEILFREPTRPFTVVGPVSSVGAPLAAENAMYRAVQKEAAELGANAIIIEGVGIGPNYNGFRRGKALQALAIRWGIENQGHGPHALSPTSTVSTTRDASQVIPSDAPLYPER
jgi:hypothetical protein